MPTWVHDPLSDRWVVRAAARAGRPRTHGSPVEGCPFCPGNEAATPPEIGRVDDGADGWLVRVFPNLYPAVEAGRTAGASPDPVDGHPVVGLHEVVAFTPEHDASFADLDDEQATLAVSVLLDRVAEHLEAGAASSQSFINHGSRAGASVEHPHGQVVSLDVVSPIERAEAEACKPGACHICAETADPARVALARPGVVVTAPRASWLRGELLVAAASHADLDPDRLGPALRDALVRLREVEGDVAYNVILHPRTPRSPDGHAHAHIIPRTATLAGFELGTGLFLSAADPERTAAGVAQASSPSNVSAAELMQ